MTAFPRDIVFGILGRSAFPEVKTIERLGQTAPWADDSLFAELIDENAFHFGARNAGDRALRAFVLSRTVLDELHIHHLCTHPDFRRRGVAGELLRHLLESARSRNSKKAFLEVAASNGAAIALYKKAGFRADRIRHKYYSTGDDAIAMSKSLDVA